jgi:hypothetical protein
MTGIAVVNVVLLAAGFCVLAPALRGLRAAVWISWAGVALLVGAALVGLGLVLAAILGATTGPWIFATVAAVLTGVGLAAAVFVPRAWLAPPTPPTRPHAGPLEDAAAIVLGAAVVVLVLALLVGGFRTSPWLDDAWGIWLPKGIALAHLGLDERLFVPNGTYVHFEVTDYPLWWSALTGLDLRIAGDVDVRTMNAQLAILVLAFVAAVARLLWGWVRPWVVWGSLLLFLASPALLRHSQSGMADLPLAVYLSLAVLAGVGWLATGKGFYLGLVVAFGAAAAAIKDEGLPEVVLMLVLLGLWARRRRAALWLAGAVAVATALPWLAWRAAHGIEGRVPLREGLDPGFLADRVHRLAPGSTGLLEALLDPTQWLLLVPLAVALALAGFIRERRAAWLALPSLLAAGFAFLVWAYWADRDDVHYVVATSAYRIVDPLVVTAAVAIPLLVERTLSIMRPTDASEEGTRR